MAITASWLKANHNKLREATEEKADGEGLSVRATKKGKLVFQLRYRWKGKAARVDLGTYPSMSLKAARMQKEEYKASLAKGVDPRKKKAIDIITTQQEDSLKTTFLLWFNEQIKNNLVGAPQILRSFEIYIFPELGDLPVRSVTVPMWVAAIEKVREESPSIATRILGKAQQMYRWTARREIAELPNLLLLSSKRDFSISKGTRGRSLSEEDLRMFYKALNTCSMFITNKILLKICLMLGCRNGELRDLRPSEIDWEEGVWTLPPEKNKLVRNKLKPVEQVRPFKRPLLPEVLALLKEAWEIGRKGEYIFVAPRVGGKISSNTSLTMPNAVINQARNVYQYPMEKWTLHDLRKTARTNFSRFTHSELAEIMIGHMIKGTQGVYDFYDYLEEQRAVSRQWVDYLKTLGA